MQMETEEFNSWMREVITRNRVSTELGIKKVALDLLTNILEPEPYGRHPIDTGRSRAAWHPSMEGLDGKFNFESGIRSDKSKVSEGIQEGSFIDNTKGLTSDKWVELINAVSYILFLEYGHSQSAPIGMVRISMRKMMGRLPAEINERFIRDWNTFISR